MNAPPAGRLTNIETFQAIVAEALAMLYEAFPVPINVHPQQLHEDLMPYQDPEGVVEIPDPDSDIRVATWRWLVREGYLRLEGEGGFNLLFCQVVLTSKGLAVLTQSNDTPASLPSDKGKTLGARLVEAATTKATERMVDLVFDILGPATKVWALSHLHL